MHTESIPGMNLCQGLLVLSDGKLLICTEKNIRSREPIWYPSATNTHVYEENIEALAEFDGILVHINGTVVTCNHGVISKRVPEISISQEIFERPTSIVEKLDKARSYIVVDSNAHCLLNYDCNGSSSVFVGSRTQGYKEGELLNASFNCPTSIVKKHSGFYYVADSGNHVIRVLDVYGVVESQHSCPLSFSTPILYTQTGYDR